MSEMEFFCGTFEESDLNITPEDTDEFYNLEEEHGCFYVEVEGKLYKVTQTQRLCNYGFVTTIPPSDTPIILAYWYNGGAGIHEVLETAIRKALDNG